MAPKKTIGDCLWIWGHPPGKSWNGVAGLNGWSDVTPAEAMYYFNAYNIFYIPCGRSINFSTVKEECKDAKRMGLSIESSDSPSSSLEKIMEAAKEYPKIDRVVFDDFFSETNEANNWTKYTPERLRDIKTAVNNAGLEFWCVYYHMQRGMDTKAWLEIFDGVSFWFWDEPGREEYEDNCAQFLNATPGQKRMLGCYLWNFGKEREAAPDMVIYQLNRGAETLRAGLIEGIILHTNILGNMGLAAYDEAKRWTDLRASEYI